MAQPRRVYVRRYRRRLAALPKSQWPPWFKRMMGRLDKLTNPGVHPRPQDANGRNIARATQSNWERHGLPKAVRRQLEEAAAESEASPYLEAGKRKAPK